MKERLIELIKDIESTECFPIDHDKPYGEEMEKYYSDAADYFLNNGVIILPCKVGDELYRITYPYRQPPKVTKYRVKNFRTIKRGQKLQLEVQADCVPARNWMYFKDFYTSREEAEKALAELGGKA